VLAGWGEPCSDARGGCDLHGPAHARWWGRRAGSPESVCPSGRPPSVHRRNHKRRLAPEEKVRDPAVGAGGARKGLSVHYLWGP